MLRVVVRRAWVQRRLLSGVVLLVVVATTLLGFCSLLLGVTGPRAFSEQVQRSQPREVDVTAYAVGVPASRLDADRDEARDVIGHALAPVHPSLVSTATSRPRLLGGSESLGYLATSDELDEEVTLTSGRWPDDSAARPVEALAPDAAARLLHLRVGDRLTLGYETGLDASRRSSTIVIVGTFRATSAPAWDSDPLSGAGFASSYSTGSKTAPTYGPFMVGPAAFVSTGSHVDGLRVDAHPDLDTADDASLREAVASLGSASALLSDRVGTTASSTRVASSLPATLSRLHAQQAVTRSAVLVVLLLGTTLALAALVLAGGLVADTRTDERELLTALGLGRGQQLVSALMEAALLAAVSTILAVPAAAVAHSVVTHLPSLKAAGLAEAPTVTPELVVTTLAGSAFLALVFVVSSLGGWASSGRLSSRRGALARSGVDVLLLVVVATAWWQLHTRPAAAAGSDVLLIVAPVVCLVLATVLAVRCLPPMFALAAAAGSRSRALLPLSLHAAALRLSAGTALVLLSTAAASAVFGVAMHTTWQRSQGDQADLLVGTGVSLALASEPSAEDAATIERAVPPGAVTSPVTARPVALGSYVSDQGPPPQLVALDTGHAGSLVRGRLENGATWSEIGHRLAPSAPVVGVPLPAGGAGVTGVGRTSAGMAVSVTPSVVVQDAAGFRSTLDAESFPVDGRPHPLRWSTPPGPGQRIVAVRLTFTHDAGGGGGLSGADQVGALSVALRVPEPDGSSAAPWSAGHVGDDSPVTDQSASVRSARDASVLTTEAHVNLSFLEYTDGEVVATAFDPPSTVPVAVSRDLVDDLGAHVGDTLSATLGDSTVTLRVAAIVPTVPSAPGQIAVLADVDTLSRALIGGGRLDPVVDAFWVSGPSAPTASALSALHLGQVTSRDEVTSELTRGPMQVTVPVAYVTLAVSAVLLLLAGAALVVSADQRRRTAEMARLRALGLTRRRARRLLAAEHGALLVPLVLTGVLIGAATAVALDVSLVRSVEGTAPVPRAVLAWPWGAELLLAGGLVLGCLVIAAVAAASQVHRSDLTRLRTEEWR